MAAPYGEGSRGYPWDRPDFYEACNMFEGWRKTYHPQPTSKTTEEKSVMSEEEIERLLGYKKRLDYVVSYLESDIANSFSLLKKSPRKKHKDILAGIYLKEDILKILKEE